MRKKFKTFLLGCLILIFGCMPISDVSAAIAHGKSNLNVSYKTKIDRLATGIVLNKTVDSLVVGQVDTLKALVTPRDTTNKSIKWTSSDPSIATVDDNGKITALKVGTVTITATVDDGRNLHAPCTVHVTNLLTKKKKVDLVFTTGSDNDFNSDDFNSKVNTYVKNALANSGIDANIESFSTSTSTVSTEGKGAQTIKDTWQPFPPSIGSQFRVSGNSLIAPNAENFAGFFDPSGLETKDITISTDMSTIDPGQAFGLLFRVNKRPDGKYDYYFFSSSCAFPNGQASASWITKVTGHNLLDNNQVNKGGPVPWMYNPKREWSEGVHGGILDSNYDFCFHYFSPTTGINKSDVGKMFTNKYPYAESEGVLAYHEYANTPSEPKITNNTTYNFKVSMIGNEIKAYRNNELIIDYKDANPIPKGTYGFGNISNVGTTYSNVTITRTTTTSKSFAEVLKEPTWRSNTKKFVINLSKDALKDIATNSSTFPSTLATMLSNKSHFIGIMDNKDKSTVNSFISQNDNLGTYIDNSDLDKALSSVTQYVLSSVNEEENNSNIFLVGDDINYSNYNSKDSDVLWSYSQDNKHLNYNNEFENCSKTGDIPLDNDLGISDFATGEWVHNKVSQFNKPGKYTISYKDKNGQVTTEIINIHRKPTPIFTAYAVSNTSTGKFDVTIKDEDKSYDIDHENSDGTRKGIVNSKFQWKEVTDGTTDTWHDGKLPSGQAANKDFLVKLEVQDLEGQWSDPLVKYVSTKNQNLAPIAQFTENTSEMPVDQLKSNASAGNDVVFTDESYDANGDSIREHWIVTDSNGSKIYDGSTAPTASVFIGKPLGTYNITLTCDDGPSPKFGTVLTSDSYTLQLKLVPINHKPVAHFKIDNTSKAPELIKITEDSTDADGDSISTKAWTVTDSKGTIVEQTENKLPDLTSLNGTYTITLKVRDNPKIQPELWSDPYSQTVIVENSNPKSK